MRFTAGLCKALPAWSNASSLLWKSSWAGALFLSQATNCQTWRGAGKRLKDVGHADEANTDRQVPGISHPTELLQPQWPLPCLPCEGKEQWWALEPARVPGPVTGAVWCLYSCGHHEDCQGHAGSWTILVLLKTVSFVPEQRHQKNCHPRGSQSRRSWGHPWDLLMLRHQWGAPLLAPTCQPTRKSPRSCYRSTSSTSCFPNQPWGFMKALAALITALRVQGDVSCCFS